MQKIELVNKTFNGKEYTLVDEYDDIIENEIIYHFSSETDDLFCLKKNDNYKIITDEKVIILIKKTYNLFPPKIIFNSQKQNAAMSLLMRVLYGTKGVKKLSEEEREKFYDIQINLLKKSGVDVDFAKLKQRLTKAGSVYMCDELDGLTLGFFHPATNATFLYDSDTFEEPTFLHETIHKATGAIQSVTLPSFFVEGGAENIVQKVYRKGNFSKIDSLITKEGFRRSVRYNFELPESKYYNEVCLLKQIEYIVGYSADKDVLSGTTNILDDFSRRYGKDTLTYVKHVGNQITRGNWKGTYEKMIKAQNLMLERVFNKDYPDELTMENAQEYLTRLQGMELHRGRIQGDDFYKEFYEDKYNAIKQELIKQGYDISEIEEKIPKYTQAEFYPTHLEKFILEQPISHLAAHFARPEDIARYYYTNNRVLELDQEGFKAHVLRKDGLFLECFTYNGMIYKAKTIRNGEYYYVDINWDGIDKDDNDNIIYLDSKTGKLKYDENGQSYEFQELSVPKGFIDEVNSIMKSIEGLRQNAISQKSTEIQETKRNLFQRIKTWLNEKKKNREQEDVQKNAEDQRDDL